MTSFHGMFAIHTPPRVSFHDVTERVAQEVESSGIKNGIALVFSQHTTCSVVIQEPSHDTNFYGTEFLLQDTLNILSALVPTALTEGQYLHPGPKHIADAESRGESAWMSLNVDAHLRSIMLGRSESIPILEGALQLGEFGRIFFADFDQVRDRERIVQIQVVG
jgi:secondary thiamine-phosphate synthase enzyme